MAASIESLREQKSVPGPLYIYEAPVRAWHWIHALSIIVLAGTGYLIANPLPSLSGEASDHFLMGTIRLVHFSTAYVFATGLFVRFYWAIVGNEYSRELLIVPVWSGEWWKRVWHEVKFYAFFTRKMSKNPGHNPLAQFQWIGRELELKPPVLGMLGVLGGHNRRGAVEIVPHHHVAPRQVHVALEDQVQGRAFQGIALGALDVRLAVENANLTTPGHHQKVHRRVVFEPHPPGAPNVQRSGRQGAVIVDLGKLGLGRGDPVEVARDVVQ